MGQPRRRMQCKHCGSDEVVKDAWAQWDEHKQEWILKDMFVFEYCTNCEGETNIIEIKLY